jgi:hypothetical protein
MNTILKSSAMAVAMLVAGLGSAAVSAAENPMDVVGSQHNHYLDCLQRSKDPSVSPLIRLVEECGFDPGVTTADFVKKYHSLFDMDPSEPLSKQMSPYRENYSDYEFSFFERIDQVVESAKDPAQADAMFADLENEAIERLDPKSRAGASILGGLSVARHSLAYWTTSGKETGQVFAARWPRWIRKLVIIASDIAGAVIATELGAGAIAGTVASTVSDYVENAIP